MPFKVGGGNKLKYYDSKTGKYSSDTSKEIDKKFKITNRILKSKNMPNHAIASTDVNKFIHYSLDPNHPQNLGKAEAYQRALGYNINNCSSLISQIHNNILMEKLE